MYGPTKIYLFIGRTFTGIGAILAAMATPVSRKNDLSIKCIKVLYESYFKLVIMLLKALYNLNVFNYFTTLCTIGSFEI